MNIHETAELIGPPSCIIALDWSEALGARPDPGERGEPGWQRRACPSAGGGRTPARPLPAGHAKEPPGTRSHRGPPAPAAGHRGLRAGARRKAAQPPPPFSAPRRAGGAEGTAAALRRRRWAAGVLAAARPAPADGGGTRGQSERPPPARPRAPAGAQGFSAPARGSQRRPHLQIALLGYCRYCFKGRKAIQPNKIALKGPNGAFELKMKTSACVSGK